MAGLKLTLPTTFSDSTLPIWRADSRLTKGSLLLVDFSHPLCDLGGVVPTTSSKFYNLAWDIANKITGLTSETVETLKPTVSFVPISGKGILEITGKKGLHTIITKTSDVSNNRFQMNVPTPINNYIWDNITRGFFVSIWSSVTRTSGGVSPFYLANAAGTGVNFVTRFVDGGAANLANSGSSSTTFPGPIGSRGSLFNSTGSVLSNIAFNQYYGGSSSKGAGSYYCVGATGVYSSSALNLSSSRIFYQMHIIDLTSAGLTYAQADALDLAAYTEAFGTTGRFYNDTYTNPSTLP